MDVFLQSPRATSYVSGVTLQCEVIPENIAAEYHAYKLVDEYLLILIEHDGSNPFCYEKECYWGYICTMSTTDEPPAIVNDDDNAFEFTCFPHGVYVTDVVVRELNIQGILGIWLMISTNGHAEEHHFSICLNQYSRAG